MKKLIPSALTVWTVLMFLALSLWMNGMFAQSYPGSIFVPLVAKDNIQTTLSQAMTAGDTTAFVASTTGWAVNMVAYICDTITSSRCTGTFEAMKVTAVPSSNALTVTRAFGGTSAYAHASGKTVLNSIASVYNTTLSNEVLAIETALGTNLSNIPSGPPSINSTAYNFAAQTPGGSLTAGSRTVTLTPCPLGVNGSNSNHYLELSAGTGTAEAALITGGTCTSGATTGNVTLTVVNAHSGAWTVTSATGGISEAIWSMTSAVGGTILLPAATLTIHAPIKRRALTPIVIEGMGMTSTVLAMATDFPLAANGLFDWSPGDAAAIPVGGANNLTISFTQPDSIAIADYTHWPPAVYTTGTNQSQWHDITIIAAWDGWKMPGNTNGLYVSNIYASFFHRLFDLDGHSYDTVRLLNVHSATQGLTANQGTCYLDPTKVNVGYYIGSVDDLKIISTTIGSPFFGNFHPGADTNYPSGFIADAWAEGNLTISNGFLHFNGYHSSGGGSLQNFITYTGGIVLMDDIDLEYAGTQTVISASAANGTGSYPPPLLAIRNSRIDYLAQDVRGVYATTSGAFAGTFNVMLQNNLFVRTSGGAYANQTILGLAGTGSTVITATGNRFTPIGGGSGVAIQVDTDAVHMFSANDGGGWTYSMPAYANLQWALNNNFSGNIHALHDPLGVSAKISATNFALNKTENWISSETGVNNAIAGALIDTYGANVPLSAGLKVTILLAHTLQAGANTFTLNAGAAKNIKSAKNAANNIGTAYAATGIVTLIYDGTQFLDISQ